ncbi:hypothetical protein QP028_10520 [Corynebacterium suedekumii]|nr:hypothetical protein QP028_10520 [Corynebacterium suedekumii]
MGADTNPHADLPQDPYDDPMPGLHWFDEVGPSLVEAIKAMLGFATGCDLMKRTRLLTRLAAVVVAAGICSPQAAAADNGTSSTSPWWDPTAVIESPVNPARAEGTLRLRQLHRCRRR